MTTDAHLHLPSLTLENFRGIRHITIPRLGRVTLLVGENGVGKTTVLEAVKVYVARGSHSTLYDLLMGREEMFDVIDENDNRVNEPDWAALFYGRIASPDMKTSIGLENGKNCLTIEATELGDSESHFIEGYFPHAVAGDPIFALQSTFEGQKRLIPAGFRQTDTNVLRQISTFVNRRRPGMPFLFSLSPHDERSQGIKCEFLGPGPLPNHMISRYWDQVALTTDENQAVESINLIFTSEVERVAAIGENEPILSDKGGRRIVAKLKHQSRPVSLRSLGDGALRLFGAAIALANSRGGFLLIDEAENGIHHSILRNYWRMVLHAARTNNVQVLATTHSWDCVRGFAQAAIEDEAEGVLVRLEKEDESHRAVEYSEEYLVTAAEQSIEVR